MKTRINVAQLVLRTEINGRHKYFLARRTKDGFWEWIGGKVEEGESIEEAAVRELKEEVRIDWDNRFSIKGVAEPYPSKSDPKYKLTPVLIEINSDKADEIGEEHLSVEHEDFAWIDLTEYDDYETLGQYKALERLDLVEGDVALSAVKNDGEYLVVQRSEENSSSGKWGFVSGKVEPEEEPREAAVRELKEEIDLDAEIVNSGDFYIGKGELGYWRLFPFLLETDSREVDLNWELSDHRWLSIEELEEMKTMGRMKAVDKLELG